jgi:hypothetical protein
MKKKLQYDIKPVSLFQKQIMLKMMMMVMMMMMMMMMMMRSVQ